MALWQPGMAITDERLEAMRPLWAIKGTDESRQNTAALEPDSALRLVLPAGVWEVYVSLGFGGHADNNGIAVHWGLASSWGLVSLRKVQGPHSSSDVRTSTLMRTAIHQAGTRVPYGNQQGSNRSFAQEEGILTAPTPGEFTLNWAQNMSSSEPSTMGAESFLRFQRIE